MYLRKRVIYRYVNVLICNVQCVEVRDCSFAYLLMCK